MKRSERHKAVIWKQHIKRLGQTSRGAATQMVAAELVRSRQLDQRMLHPRRARECVVQIHRREEGTDVVSEPPDVVVKVVNDAVQVSQEQAQLRMGRTGWSGLRVHSKRAKLAHCHNKRRHTFEAEI